MGPVGNYRGIDLTPDGTHVAAHRHDGNGGDIWVTDLARSTTSRFTFDASQENASPIWSPDATHIVYGSTRNGKWSYPKTSRQRGLRGTPGQIERHAVASELVSQWELDRTWSSVRHELETCGSCHCQATGNQFHCSKRHSLNPTHRSSPTGSGL